MIQTVQTTKDLHLRTSQTLMWQPSKKKLLVYLPYIPGVSNQLKRILQKAGCKSYFKSGTMLKNVLCGKKGVYKITCPWAPSSAYIGQMSQKFSI
jgi:hypothetical protein